MDMFDFSQILELAKIEPGSGAVQSILLFMIWWQGRGVKKEIVGLKDGLAGLKDGFSETKSYYDKRFERIENRLSIIETKR